MKQLARKGKGHKKEADAILEEIQHLTKRREELNEELQENLRITTSDDAIDTTSIRGTIQLISQDIEKLEKRLENLGSKGNTKSSVVSLNDTIKLKCIYGNGIEEINVSKIVEAHPNNDEISKVSPVGKAVLGHSVGETVTVLVTDKNGQTVNSYSAIIMEKV